MTIAVLFADGFEEVEAVTPVDYLRRSGATVLSVSCKESNTVTGSHGVTVLTDIRVSDLAEAAPDGIVVPGGMPGAANVAACEAAVTAVADVHRRGGIVAAICAAPAVVLAKTGILRGKRYTCYPGMEQRMPEWCGAEWQSLTAGARKTDERCVVDGTLVTAAGPGAAEEFSLQLIRLVAGEAAAEKVRTGGVMRPLCQS